MPGHLVLFAKRAPVVHTSTPPDAYNLNVSDIPSVGFCWTGAPPDAYNLNVSDIPSVGFCWTGAPPDAYNLNVSDELSVMVTHIETPPDAYILNVSDEVEGFPEVHLYLSLLTDGTRRLSWTDTGIVYLIVDGAIYAESSLGYLDLPETFEARGILIGYTEMPDPLPSPRDEVQLTWTGDTDATYDVDRQPDGGAWADVADVLGFDYRDGPLADGLYHYRVTATDEEGDTATSATADATIDAYPDAPSGIAYAWDDDTNTLTVSWTASASADVASYPVRSNAGSGTLNLTSAPVQDTAALTYVQAFTTETGEYTFMVRAKDSDGFEEPGLTQILTVNIVAGELQAYPVEPSLVYAEPAGGGTIKVGWLYRPWQEGANPGAAHEARIYWDNGSGTVSFVSPVATVAMSHPTAEASYSWTSGVLVDDTEYRFVVRIATDASPAGVETQNTGEVFATADSDVPTTPVLTASVV